MELVALRVLIGLHANGHAAYPDFNNLEVVLASGLDWSSYIDRYGSGWVYDKTCGHQDEGEDSPRGTQWAVVLVPEAFAMEADDKFPDQVEIMTEEECEDFWENKGHAHVDDLRRDAQELQALVAERALRVSTNLDTTDLDVRIGKALDPDHPFPGVRRDPSVSRTLSEYKKRKGAKLLSPVSRRRLGHIGPRSRLR